jgi:F-type H+-transporting ATPase subunit gamma
LLPLDAWWQKDFTQIHWPTKNLPELFGHDEATLLAFIREYLFISLFTHAPSLSPAKMPAGSPLSNARRRIAIHC